MLLQFLDLGGVLSFWRILTAAAGFGPAISRAGLLLHTLCVHTQNKQPHPPQPTTVLQLFLVERGCAAVLWEWWGIACEDLIQCLSPRWVTSVARDQQICPCQVYTLHMSEGTTQGKETNLPFLFVIPATAYNYELLWLFFSTVQWKNDIWHCSCKKNKEISESNREGWLQKKSVSPGFCWLILTYLILKQIFFLFSSQCFILD